jgi:hypothetical protein
MAPSLLFIFVAAAAQNMTDAEALMQMKKSFTNSSWLITTRDGSKSPCAAGSHEWHGVVCGRDGAVTSLRLSGLELGGTIDVDALAAFPALRSVSFALNNFSGPLPAFHHQLTALKSLYLSNNSFSGAIPDGFFADLGHLKKLWLDGNRLSGPVPASVVQASSLIELRLDRNALTGTLPDAPPSALRSFDVSKNNLEGVVPEAFRRFEVARFAGNEYLCYVPTHVKRCKREETVLSASKRVVLVLVVAVVLCACTSRSSSGRVRGFDEYGNKQRRLDNEMEGLQEKPPVHMSKQASAGAHVEAGLRAAEAEQLVAGAAGGVVAGARAPPSRGVRGESGRPGHCGGWRPGHRERLQGRVRAHGPDEGGGGGDQERERRARVIVQGGDGERRGGCSQARA